MRSWIGWSVLVVLLSGCAAAGPYGISLGSPGSTSGESVDLRVTRVEGRLDQMNKRIDAVGERMEGVEGGVIHAQETADQASRRATAVDTRLTRLWTNRFNQRTASSLEVFFPQDSSDLNDAAQTALLGVAKAFATGPRPKRSVVFIWHVGEEAGLLGSRYNADFPIVPLDKATILDSVKISGDYLKKLKV